MEYNTVIENGRKVHYIKNKTSFRIYDDLLHTDYFRTILNRWMEEKATENPSLVEGSLVTDRRGLKKKLASERIMVDLVMNRFLENELNMEEYLFFQRYVGSVVLREVGAENLELRIDRGVNEEYFRQKGIKLAEMGRSAEWKLHSVIDIVRGHCTLGHEIRYAFTAINNFGDKLVFGKDCVADFFEIDKQLQSKITDSISRIREITDDYYNDYHAYYEVHKKLDNFMHKLVLYTHKAAGSILFTKEEINYLNQFIDYGLPVPRELAGRLGSKIDIFLSQQFNNVFYNTDYSVVREILSMFHCFAQGAHGYTKKDLTSEFPTNFLGDRVKPKEVKKLAPVFEHISFTNSNFTLKMAESLTEDQFMMLLRNMHLLNTLGRRLAEDSSVSFIKDKTGYATLTHRVSGLSLAHNSDVMKHLFGLDLHESQNDILVSLMTKKLNLVYNIKGLFTKEAGFLGYVDERCEIGFNNTFHPKAKLVHEFLVKNKDAIPAQSIVTQVLVSGYVKDSNPNSIKWIDTVVIENGLEPKLTKQVKSNNIKGRLSEIYNEVKDRRDELELNGLAFPLKILDTAINTGSISDKQAFHIKKLDDYLNDNPKPKEVPTSVSSSNVNYGRLSYSDLLKKLEGVPDRVTAKNLDYALNILRTVVERKIDKASDKQEVHINKLRLLVGEEPV